MLPLGRSVPFTRWWGWGVYLLVTALMTPVLRPLVGHQFAIIDFVNLFMMGLFVIGALANRSKIQLPFMPWMIVIAIGSLIAVTNAHSWHRSRDTMLQDFYLYAWFAILVNIMKDRGDLKRFRVAWVWAGILSGMVGIYILIQGGQTSIWRFLGPRGERSVGFFDGPNSLADYLVASLFVALSLIGQVKARWVWASVIVLLVQLVATKSNGSMSAFLVGLFVWGVVLAFTRARSPLAVVSGFLLAAGIGGMALWLQAEWDLGGKHIRELQQQSFVARLERSTDGREQIWERLITRYGDAPLGIGPANSAGQRLSVGHRERKNSHISKEAHNDYIAYLVERGPLGLLGLLGFTFAAFFMLRTGYLRHADRSWRAGAGGAMAAALAGGLVASAIHSITMEKLHFRHYWLFLALVAAFGAKAAVSSTRVSALVSRARGGAPQAIPAAALGNGSRPEAG